jgi:hypothetical protein
MHPRPTRRRTLSAAAVAAALFTLSGCQNGDLSKRDDGKVAAASAQRDSLAYETQVREAAARLMRDHPGLSPKDADAEARASTTASYELTGPTRAERERAEAQDKFEDDLAKLDK